MRIEIAGIIGSGKSSLAKLLLEQGFGIILEEFKLNPFWKAFYSNPNKYNFETEVTFLLQHYHELKRKLEQETNIVCDFSFTQDLAYAVMGLKQKQLNIFKLMYNLIVEELGDPTLLIYMKCSPVEAVRRIKLRARKEEELINETFLSSLYEFIEEEIKTKLKQKKLIKYLEIDTEQYNMISNPSDQRFINQKIKQMLSTI